MRLPPTIAAAATLLLVAAGCGGSGGPGSSSQGCGPILREALDPQFLVHVLGDANVQYLSDPPTSGPHRPSPPITGVQSQPIPKPVQVGLLEAGDILVQHGPGLSEAQRAQLGSLAGKGVVVAPASDLPAAIVATAWVYKRSCSSLDLVALREFVRLRAGKAPGTETSP